MTPLQQVTRNTKGTGKNTKEGVPGENDPRHGEALQEMCHMPEILAASACEITACKNPDWMTMV